MTSRYWIKLWIEILDDPKMGKMPDWLWRRTVELFLLAGENGNDGELPSVSDMAWRLRSDEPKLSEALRALERVGVVEPLPEGKWKVKNFVKRNEALDDVTRQRLHRESSRKGDYYGHHGVTKRDTDTETDSETETEQKERESGPPDDFSKMQGICEKLTGRLLVPPGDVETINLFIQNGVIEEDIMRAVAWYADQSKVIASIKQIQGSVLYQVGARKQGEVARNAPKNGNGHRPVIQENSLAAELKRRRGDGIQ